jgi:hypothetical protein
VLLTLAFYWQLTSHIVRGDPAAADFSVGFGLLAGENGPASPIPGLRILLPLKVPRLDVNDPLAFSQSGHFLGVTQNAVARNPSSFHTKTAIVTLRRAIITDVAMAAPTMPSLGINTQLSKRLRITHTVTMYAACF